MKPVKILCFIAGIILLPLSSVYAQSVTFYNDSALVEVAATAKKGMVEILLPADFQEGSLRIKPVGTTEIASVHIIPAKGGDGKKEKELEGLNEQKLRLKDRLQALETREQIFTAAAKSQSGKTPRKTKTNPEPLQSIRQGTDFAIAQLEAVYTARRRTEQELKRIEAKLAKIAAPASTTANIAQVTLKTQKGAVAARYMVAEGWKPGYDLRYSGGETVRTELVAQIPQRFTSGYRRFAVLSRQKSVSVSTPVSANGNAIVARYDLPVSDQFFGELPGEGFTVKIKNNTSVTLPAGSATVYNKGEYVGKVRFEALSSGKQQVMGNRR